MSGHSAEKATPVRVAYVDVVRILIHRSLSQHGPGEACDECLTICHHCGDVGPQGEDHTCPCPYSDADCPNHRGQGFLDDARGLPPGEPEVTP